MGAEQHSAPRGPGLAHQFQELPLHQRVQAAGGFIQDQQFRVMHEGLHQSELLPVPFGQGPHGPGQIQAQPLSELVNTGCGNRGADLREVLQQGPAPHPPADPEVARQVTDPAAQGSAPGTRGNPQNKCCAGRGSDDIHQQPQGRGLT